jgi:uncharacterized repeat protein (TIGR01451 family)
MSGRVTTRRASARGLLAALAASAAWACIDVTDIDVLQVPNAGVVFGQAFLDLNLNGAIDPGDSPVRGAKVALVSAGTSARVREATTDTVGLFIIRDVPLGTYNLVFDSAVLSDSLTTVSSTPTITVDFGDTLQVNLGATYPTLTLAQVRAAAPGRRVFTHGIALNTRPSNGDGVVHFQEGATYLRATSVPPINIAPGDSVRLLGRTALDGGQPTLAQTAAVVLRPNAVFLTVPLVSIASASGANGGALDAALVRIGPAEIGDTASVGGHLRFWAHNGADSVEVLLRDYLQISPNPAIRPDTIVRVVQATGVLVPYVGASGPRWRLQPRGGADVVTQIKVADVAVTAAFTPNAALTGNTVEIVVTVRNVAPPATHTATGVSVSNPIPAGLLFLSATVTRGSYDQGTGRWSVGSLAAGAAADTLRIRVQVTAGPGTVTNVATSGGLTREAEASSFNDGQAANLTIS